MPLYEYRCKNCGHHFEKIQSFSAPEEKECPVCHGPVEKLISASAIQFKGSGWYVNDYAGKSSSMKASAAKESDKGSKSNEGSSSGTSSDKPSSSNDSSSSSSTTPSSSSTKSE
ncbi:MAG: zinc ribbon domain-containing protein [Acidobacteriaceae bacterium]